VSAPPWAQLRARLEAMGFRPSRALGQNFLLDPNLARAIARDAALPPGERVLEVGPGCGALSRELVARGAPLLAVEIDRRLVELAREAVAGAPDAEVLRADVLAGKHALAPEVLARLPERDPWHVVANLPYSAGTPFLVVASRLPNPPRSMTVLLQRELVDRLAAQPGGRAWGPVGVRLRLLYRVEVLRQVGPELFWPRPRVDSAVARLELRAERPAPGEVGAFDRLVEHLFTARRKTLASRLASWSGGRPAAAALLEELGLDPRARPEELDVPALLALVRRLAPA
jgi:16S rRNA (adenine1518-N6/adenine1519-N6)-dimethyltransferase